MNTQTIDAKRVHYGEMLEPGDFCFDDELTHLYIILPGHKHPDAIAINHGPPGGERVWGWDGNQDTPTLTPSISAPSYAGQEGWHGYLTNGRLVSC